MEKFIYIGITQKTHGTNGEIKVKIEDHFLEDFAQASVIFLRIKGKEVPYFVEAIRGKDPLIIKFEDVDNKEAAKHIVNKELFMRREEVQDKLEKEANDLDQYEIFVGFEMIEVSQGTIGPIREIVEMPQQILAIVVYQGKEIYIPLNEQFIEKVEEDKRSIWVELPEGLLDL